MVETLTLEEYWQRALRCDWRSVYQDYWQDFDDGPDAWAFQE